MASRNNALRHGLARPISNDPAAVVGLDALTAVLAGGSNDPLYRELARDVAISFVDVDRIRIVRAQILSMLGEPEKARLSDHIETAIQLERLWRYERRALSNRRRALRALRSRGSST